MFTNLVESRSHAKEFKRRGSFVLFTTITYAVLMVVMGVVSIYAYDARLEEQNLEMIVLIHPQDIATEVPVQPASQPDRSPKSTDNNESNIPTREIAMAPVDTPQVVPDKVSAAPNKNLPVPNGLYRVTGKDYDPAKGAGTPGLPGTGKQVAGTPQRIEIEDPPPAPDPPKTPKVISKGPITGQATFLPQPPYPPLARQMRIQGRVSVQVLIDEQGKVISAVAMDGSPFLTSAAQKAALQARFSPTTLGGLPVRVSGVIFYDFKLTN